ncbi:MAG: hypothetical protein PF487_12630, partial [Bacteroidales bacterium]|nr:hypothetical protein [Bacteroidales bacterium]
LIDFCAPESDKDYFSRLFVFVKRNIKLYVLDFFFLFMLLIPPYNTTKTLLIFGLFFLLSFRDIILMRLNKFYIQRINISDDKISITIYRYSKFYKTHKLQLSDVDIDSYDKLNFRILKISKNNMPFIKQFPFGYWSNDKINDLLYKIDYQKRQREIEKMF